MFRVKLLSIALTAFATIAAFSAATLVNAEGTAFFRGGDIVTGGNRSFPNCDWCDPVEAGPGQAIEFRVLAQNMVPDTTATNVRVTANLPTEPQNSPLVGSATVSADNAPSVTDTLTVNFGSGMQAFAYIPGHVRIFSPSCPQGCEGSDSIVNGGISVGNLNYGESAQVAWKAYVTNYVQPSPSPSASPSVQPSPSASPSVQPSPSASPSVAPSASPSVAPSASPSVQPSPSAQGNQTLILKCPDGRDVTVIAGQNANVNTLCQSQQQSQNNNQTINNNSSSTSNPTINITTASQPAVLGTSTVTVAGVKELPKTGLPLLAWVGAMFIPAGMKFKKAGLNKQATNESAKYIWEKREFNKN